MDPPRRAAYDAVAAVHRDDAYANLVLPRLLSERGVVGRDAAFATELAYGTLRLTGTLDAIIAAAARRPVDRVDPPVRDALRLGAYQLLRTRVAPHAATATTVDLVAALVPAASGFANAVLRRVGERDWDGWLRELAPADPVERLAFEHAHPAWVVRAFADALRGDLDETARALAADNEAAQVHLCARPARADAAELAAQVGGAPGPYSPYAVRLAGGAPGEIAAVAAGRAHVQDEGSQLVALALAGAALSGPGVPTAGGSPAGRPEAGGSGGGGSGAGERGGREPGAGQPGAGGPGGGEAGEHASPAGGPDASWLDLCAGPGGKAALLGALAAQRGARVTAVEIAPHRAELVRRATRGLPVTVVCADGRDVGAIAELPAAGFDRVLVDAPCSGLGSLRRRPEARWRRQPSDLPPLTRLQRELLAAALRAVRPGGVVGYATCSPHPVETEVSVAEAVRRAGIAVERLDARPLMPGVPDLGAGPSVQLWPHRHGTDAMFLALLRAR